MSTSPKRRSIYRVHPGSRDDLVVSLVTPTGEVPATEVIDVTVNGACARFSAEDAPSLPAGGTVKLVLQSPTLRERTEVEATVISGVESESERRYNFRFDRADRLFQRAFPEFFGLLNRRAAPRGFEPGEDDGARVGLKLPPKFDDDTLYPAHVRNISTTGVSVELSEEVDYEFVDADGVEICIDLPGHEETLHTKGRVRYRDEQDSGAVYGLMFVWPDSQESLDKIEQLTEYMLQRFDLDLGDESD